jgi:hypothetical protein
MDFLGEISDPVAGFSPDLSFGTHFFQDLVESSVFYIGIFPQNENVEFNINMLDSYNDIFADLLPENQNMKDIIKVYNLKDSKMYIASDVKNQKLVCYCSYRTVIKNKIFLNLYHATLYITCFQRTIITSVYRSILHHYFRFDYLVLKIIVFD